MDRVLIETAYVNLNDFKSYMENIVHMKNEDIVVIIKDIIEHCDCITIEEEVDGN